MKRVLAFAASNSIHSINKKLVTYASSLLLDVEIEILDLNDYEMPIYSIDREKANGIPDLAHQFKAKISASDGIMISFAEHNSAYSAAYKNIYDWVSRIGRSVWDGKPMLLMATSPGGRGAKGVLELAEKSYGRANPNVVGSFSLPGFSKNFDETIGLTEPELLSELKAKVAMLQAAL